MGTWAILPVKGTRAAKSRLAAELSAAQRERLMQWMLETVLDALADSPWLEGVVTVGEAVRDPRIARMLHVADPGRGPNAAVDAALELLQRRGADAALVIAGDLPLLEAGDLEALAEAGRAAGVALGTDRHGTGTNAVYLSLPTDMRTSFGPGSLERHLAAARARGFEASVLRREGLAVDIDERDDLAIVRALRPEIAGVLEPDGDR